MRFIVAVSGGIDSVVLLDMLASTRQHDLIVAHFDHGIRGDSAADARFVAGLAAKYGIPFVSKREELGAQASEELARQSRYAFLREQAEKHDAIIVTAHHQDDVVESVAINLTRGTGWKGLAVLDSVDIYRPLLPFSKAQLRDYVAARRLEWVEDETNATPTYLRNRLRQKIHASAIPRHVVAEKHRRQTTLKKSIDQEVTRFINDSGRYQRHFFIMIDPATASELLRAAIATKTGWSPTRPQTARALMAIKTARPGTTVQVGAGATLRFTTHTFVVGTA